MNSNPFFNAMSGGNNILNMYQQFRANPMQFLVDHKINIPQNAQSDPNAIINYLLQTGQLTQAQINGAYQAAQQLGMKK